MIMEGYGSSSGKEDGMFPLNTLFIDTDCNEWTYSDQDFYYDGYIDPAQVTMYGYATVNEGVLMTGAVRNLNQANMVDSWYYCKNMDTWYAVSTALSADNVITLTGDNVSAIKSVTYTGKALQPSVTVKDGSTVLKKGTDYTLSYTNNKNAGKATAVIKGIGKYTGVVTKTFTIKKAGQSLKVAAKKSTVDVKKKAKAVKAVSVSGNKTKVTCKKVKVTAAESTNYKKAVKTVTSTIKVK